MDQEKKLRDKFHTHHFAFLPSHFYNQLVDKVPVLSLEGKTNEFSFPDLTDCNDVICEPDPFSVFGPASADRINSSKQLEKEIEGLSEQVEMLKI